jgi:hypothetical protein
MSSIPPKGRPTVSEMDCLVYDRESGDVVHGHHATSLDLCEPIVAEAIVDEAVALASRHTGIDSKRLDTVQVVLEELDPSMAYRVVDGQLVVEPINNSFEQLAK